MEASIKEHKIQVQDLDRPQEFRIFHESTKVEQKISKTGIIFVKIQLYLKTCSRNKNGKDRQT